MRSCAGRWIVPFWRRCRFSSVRLPYSAGFLLSRQEILALTALAGAPWWAWAGGFLGAFFVTSSIILTPRLGAANTVSSILAGQIFASILLDHFGLLNLPVHAVTLPKIVGAVLVMIGVIVVFRT